LLKALETIFSRKAELKTLQLKNAHFLYKFFTLDKLKAWLEFALQQFANVNGALTRIKYISSISNTDRLKFVE
jgi:hypothetical protein